MFKATLLATTVFAVGASVALAHPAVPKPQLPKDLIPVTMTNGHAVTAVVVGHGNAAQRVTNNREEPAKEPKAALNTLSKDKNAEFISFYGYTIENYHYSYSGSYNYKESAWYHDAVPVVGNGKAVTTIEVPIYGDLKGTAGLYSNNASNLPGNVIVSGAFSGTVTTSDCCTQLQTISIPSTTLNSGTTYWLEVNADTSAANSENYGLWLMEDTNLTSTGNNDLFQYHDYFEEDGVTYSNYMSSWTAETSPPAAPAAKVK